MTTLDARPLGERAGAVLGRLGAGATLGAAEARRVVGEVMRGEWGEGETAALLMGLRARGETAEELSGAAAALRDEATPLGLRVPGLLDTCGTGGDGAGTFNISTAAALVAAACGIPVAKHGNRSATGVSGSADVLEALGVGVEAPAPLVERCLADTGFGFFFTPVWHPSLRRLAPLRRRLGFRTMFNLLGPLANPAHAEFQLVGAGRLSWADPLAQALALSGVTATVVTGSDGLDEVTLSGATRAACVRDGRVVVATWTAADFGLPAARTEGWHVRSVAESAAVVLRVLEGRAGPARDVVLANAAAALWTAGRVPSLRDGVDLGMSVIESGAARQKLDVLVAATAGPREEDTPCSPANLAWLLD